MIWTEREREWSDDLDFELRRMATPEIHRERKSRNSFLTIDPNLKGECWSNQTTSSWSSERNNRNQMPWAHLLRKTPRSRSIVVVIQSEPDRSTPTMEISDENYLSFFPSARNASIPSIHSSPGRCWLSTVEIGSVKNVIDHSEDWCEERQFTCCHSSHSMSRSSDRRGKKQFQR